MNKKSAKCTRIGCGVVTLDYYTNTPGGLKLIRCAACYALELSRFMREGCCTDIARKREKEDSIETGRTLKYCPRPGRTNNCRYTMSGDIIQRGSRRGGTRSIIT